MAKKLLVLVFLLLSVLGCKNSALNPDDFSRKAIDKKYPYWQVGISHFEIDNRVGKYTAITIDEKKYMLACMALIRLAVNTPEFAEGVKKAKAQLKSSVGDSYGGQNLKYGDQYDPQKLLECIYSLKYDFAYTKMNTAQGTGDPGKSRYLRHGLQPENEIPMGKWVGFHSGNWGTLNNVLFGDYFTYLQSQAYANVAALMFHEHMHNIGFNHFGDYSVPYVLDGVVRDILNRILWKDQNLRNKYSKQVNELIAYYLTEYKHLLTEDTVFDPNKK